MERGWVSGHRFSSSEGAKVHSLGRQPQDESTQQSTFLPAPNAQKTRAAAEDTWG